MLKGKTLYTTKIKDHPDLSVYGVFNTQKVHWDYYVISHNSNSMTSEICQINGSITTDRIMKFGKKVNTKEEGISFITEYKDKWEMGTNDTRQENRDKKIDDILQ